MRFLDPEQYGLWLSVLILLTYSGYVHFGLEHGLGIRVPYYQGQGNAVRATQIADTVYIAWTSLALLLGAGVILYAVVVPQVTMVTQWGLIIVAGLTVLGQQTNYLTRWQTAGLKDFVLPSKLSIARSFLSFCVIVPLAYFLNVMGVMIGTLIVTGINLALWVRMTPYRLRWQISSDVLKEIWRIGFPIFLVVLGGALIETVDRLLILRLLGTVSLGYYGVTALGGSLLYRLLSQAGSAMAPHMVEEMGKSADSPSSMEKFLVKPTIIIAYISAILIMMLFFSLPPLVETVLPKYIPGLPAFYLFIPGFFFLGIILTANNALTLILIARQRQRISIYVQVLAIAVEVFAAVFLIGLGWDIAGVALASTLAYAVYGSSILVLASRYVLPQPERMRRFLVTVMTPFVYVMTVSLPIYAIGEQWFSNQIILKGVTQLVLCGLAVVPMLIWLSTRVEVTQEFLPLMNAVGRRIRAVMLRHK